MSKLSLAEVMQCLREEFSTDKWSRQSVKDILERFVKTAFLNSSIYLYKFAKTFQELLKNYYSLEFCNVQIP